MGSPGPVAGNDMFDLRKESPAINFAIRKCLASLEMLRPSLFSGGDDGEARPDGFSPTITGSGDNIEVLHLLRKQQSEIDGIRTTLQEIANKVGA